MCPHHFSPGSPTLVVLRGCGCPLTGAGDQSSSGPVPHMHPSAYFTWTTKGELEYLPHQKETNPPSCHPNCCSHPDTSALKRSKVILNFKNNQGLMEVTAGGYCSSPQEKMPQVFTVSPQSSGLVWLFQAVTGGTSAAQRKLRLSEAESGVFPILTGKKRPKIRDPS